MAQFFRKGIGDAVHRKGWVDEVPVDFRIETTCEKIEVPSFGSTEKDPDWKETCRCCQEEVTWDLGLFTGRTPYLDEDLEEHCEYSYYCGNCGCDIDPGFKFVPGGLVRQYITGETTCTVNLVTFIGNSETVTYTFFLEELHAKNLWDKQRLRPDGIDRHKFTLDCLMAYVLYYEVPYSRMESH